MGVRQYRLGLKHGQAGVRHMAHRRMRPYDSASAQRSYNDGYKKGYSERMRQGKGLDYTNPFNTRWFDDP